MNRLKSFIRKHSTILLKVYVNYALLVIIFAILLGLIFISLYRDTSTNDYKEKLERRANKMSASVQEYILDRDYDECLNYLNTIRDVEEDEIWIVANATAKNPLSSRVTTFELSSEELQQEYTDIILGAFGGEGKAMSFFSELHDATTFTAAVPIYGENDEIAGALVLIESMESMDKLLSSSSSIVMISALAALVVAFILAFVFARQISDPIRKMRAMILELREGNYSIKSSVQGYDEVADLARTLDLLAVQLHENEEMRKTLEQTRIDFFANVSHELRTPIAVVRAYTESLVDGVVTDEETVNQYYGRMLTECRSMERLVGDLLTLSKMQNPDFVVEKEPVNIVEIFGELTRTINTVGKEKNVTLDIKKDSDVLLMMGDYDRLRQMFLVICDNAVKFSNENSQIHVTLKKQDDKLVASIKDDGIGISKEELPIIFDKFYKSKLRQNAKGSGLGLSIAKHICLKHDGTIEVSSEPGKGTEFVFTFRAVSESELEAGNF